MRRGEVWWADLGPGAGRRPVVLLSRNQAYGARTLVTVAPVTTRVRQIGAEVALGPADGLPRLCVANLDTITTVPVANLQDYITTLAADKMAETDAAIHYALGLTT